MILHLLRMRRNVNRNVFNDRKNVSATVVVAHRERDKTRTGSSMRAVRYRLDCTVTTADSTLATDAVVVTMFYEFGTTGSNIKQMDQS